MSPPSKKTSGFALRGSMQLRLSINRSLSFTQSRWMGSSMAWTWVPDQVRSHPIRSAIFQELEPQSCERDHLHHDLSGLRRGTIGNLCNGCEGAAQAESP